MNTFKDCITPVLQPNTLRKKYLDEQRLEKALSESIDNSDLNANSVGVRRGSVPGEWRLNLSGNPEVGDGTRVRRASMPGGRQSEAKGGLPTDCAMVNKPAFMYVIED